MSKNKSKESITYTDSDNQKYFEGKLKSNNKIERIIRDKKNENGIETGIISRRKQAALKVRRIDKYWTIYGVVDAAAAVHKIVETETKEKDNTALKQISKLSDHDHMLLLVVKFDCNEDALNQALIKNTSDLLLENIPKFHINEKYKLNEIIYQVVDIKGEMIKFQSRNGIKRKHIEIDTIGEFFRPINNNMDIIHAEDKLTD